MDDWSKKRLSDSIIAAIAAGAPTRANIMAVMNHHGRDDNPKAVSSTLNRLLHAGVLTRTRVRGGWALGDVSKYTPKPPMRDVEEVARSVGVQEFRAGGMHEAEGSRL